MIYGGKLLFYMKESKYFS